MRPGASLISSTLRMRSRYFSGRASGWQKLPAKKITPEIAGDSLSCTAKWEIAAVKFAPADVPPKINPLDKSVFSRVWPLADAAWSSV